MESERVVLVCLKNRTREVRLESDGNTAAPFSLSVLDQAVRAKFADLPSLSDTSQLILQVKSDKWEGMYVDLLPGDEVKAGSVIKAEIENPDPVPVAISPVKALLGSPVSSSSPISSQRMLNMGENAQRESSSPPAQDFELSNASHLNSSHFPSESHAQTQLIFTSTGQLAIQKTGEVGGSSSQLGPFDKEKILEAGKIYKKESLSKYHRAINDASGELAVQDPSLLTRRGDLLNLARVEVQKKGYSYVKGKSRSKRFMSPPSDTPAPTRTKVSAKVRQKRIAALKEDISSLDRQIHFKNKRLQQAEGVKNYKLCEEINEEVQVITRQKRELTEELRLFREKERKARWYRKSRKSSAYNVASDESDIPLSSPSSSMVRSSTMHSESDSDDDSASSVFQAGLPVSQQ